MTKWLVVVESNCTDSAREDEFNEWYNQVHLSDMLSIPEVVRAVRYENLDPHDGKGKYMATYEVEADDLQSVLEAGQARSEQWAAEGRMSDLMEIIGISTYKHKITSTG